MAGSLPPVEKTLVAYNVDPEELAGLPPDEIFTRRRDSCFACCYRGTDGSTVAVRDHFGVVPLYHRGESASITFEALVRPGDELSDEGVRAFLGLGTTRVVSPIAAIGVVPPGGVLRWDAGAGEPRIEYRYEPPSREPYHSGSPEELVDELDHLMARAMRRLVVTDRVALLLSGGIDSALIASYLRELGVEINAYTSVPWGPDSPVRHNAERVAKLCGVRRHMIDFPDAALLEEHAADLDHHYQGPHAGMSSIALAGLLRNTGLAMEPQVFVGQNADTMSCSTAQQSLILFASRAPGRLRRRLNPLLGRDGAVGDYLAFTSDGFLREHPPNLPRLDGIDPLRGLTLAGIYVSPAPRGAEVASQPFIVGGSLTSNPFYDADLIEFWLRVPLRGRLTVDPRRRVRRILTLDKRPFKGLMKRRFPGEKIVNKHAWSIPFEATPAGRRFLRDLPTRWEDRRLTKLDQRLRARSLRRFADRWSISADIT